MLHVRALLAEPGSRLGLVYTASRKDAESFADQLGLAGVRRPRTTPGCGALTASSVHEDFLEDRLDVVVATSAFGMGIDKPDVRFVVHTSAPESLDSYYQQIGRAGRDGEPAADHLVLPARGPGPAALPDRPRCPGAGAGGGGEGPGRGGRAWCVRRTWASGRRSPPRNGPGRSTCWSRPGR